MPVISSKKDLDALTLTFVAEFDAPIERVWQLWRDPRQLERWWGPPGWPATFDEQEFEVGRRASYYMTGPEGEKAHGWWEVTALDAPNRFEYDDGFADETGRPDEAAGTGHGVVTLESVGDKTRMSVVSSFQSLEQLQQMMEMGMEDGMREAMGQIDALLAEVAA
jgi:uncharacterized protein YndB with AHSA1/START domain